MARTIRVGTIGAGGIAGAHIKRLQDIKDVEVVAVCDIRKDAAESTANKFNVPEVFYGYKDLLKLKQLDAVSVCTPNYFHAEPTVAALRAGKHVIVEKPMAMTVREAKAMVDAARKTRKVLVVGFQLRYSGAAQMLKRSVDDGLLGKIVYCHCRALRRRGPRRAASCLGRDPHRQQSRSGAHDGHPDQGGPHRRVVVSHRADEGYQQPACAPPHSDHHRTAGRGVVRQEPLPQDNVE